MKSIVIQGPFTVKVGDVVSVTNAAEVTKEKWMVPSIENLTNGESEISV